MPDYNLNRTARSSAIQRWQRCQCCSLITWRWRSRSRSPIFVSASYQTALDPQSMTRETNYSGDKVRPEPRFEPCLTLLIIGSLEEPEMVHARIPNYSLNWTAKSIAIERWQRCHCCSSPTWIWPSQNRGLSASSLSLGIGQQGPMLYKSDNGVSDASSPSEGNPAKAGGPFGLKSVMEHWPSDPDDRQSAEKPQICVTAPPLDRTWH